MKLTRFGRTDNRSTLGISRLRTRRLIRMLTEDSERLVTAADLRDLRA
ncbi:hypothetical protein [Tsukamurella soli]|uniref:Uncharacterized protein n=1 Tax=Tsukamurella soli TaxID=644556 RepID=A0ABP8JKH7_9ACTN